MARFYLVVDVPDDPYMKIITGLCEGEAVVSQVELAFAPRAHPSELKYHYTDPGPVLVTDDGGRMLLFVEAEVAGRETVGEQEPEPQEMRAEPEPPDPL